MCMFCRSLFVLLTIVLSVLVRFTDPDYPFGIFKLFLYTIVYSPSDVSSGFEEKQSLVPDRN